MFRSLPEDRDYLRQVVRPWREWESIDEAFQHNTFSVQMFCLILQYVQFNCEPADYKIRGYRCYWDANGHMIPESMHLAFGKPNAPTNSIWLQNGLITWTRDRHGDFPLVGVPALQQFIKSLHAE